MEKSKIPSHSYPSRRNKIPKLEENNENPSKNSTVLSKTKNAESPSTARFCMISGYASPPCRLVTLSQQSENEIVWDLTSPSARKYQVMLSDKKTSTPNQTPTRSKRELRPRIALCKKNIALTEDKSGDLVNELAVLNDLVNTQHPQTIMTPPRSVKGLSNEDCESPIDIKKSVIPINLNTSDAFDDDSFFSESILLSTQALEEEAFGCNPTPSKKSKANNQLLSHSLNSPNGSSSLTHPNELTPERNASRRSFDLDSVETESLAPFLTENVRTLVSPKDPITKLAVKKENKDIPLCCKTRSPDQHEPNPHANQFSIRLTRNSNTCFNLPSREAPKTLQATLPANKHVMPKSSEPITSEKCKKDIIHGISRTQEQIVASRINPVSEPSSVIGIKSIVDKQIVHVKQSVPQSSPVVTLQKLGTENRSNSQSVDLFDDDDDELLCAIAEEIESRIGPVTASCASKIDGYESDDGFFQPEVLAYISQIETRAVTKVKSTADLLEEKRQAAIQKRKERLMSRH